MRKNGKARADDVRAALAALLERDGTLEPEAVVKAAKSPRSPLHGEFEWDDKVAGHRYRMEQARSLIARVRVEFQTITHTIRVPEYVRDPHKAQHEQGYAAVATLRTDRGKALDVLRNEVERTAALLQRTRDLAAALDLENELDPILAEFDVFRNMMAELV